MMQLVACILQYYTLSSLVVRQDILPRDKDCYPEIIVFVNRMVLQEEAEKVILGTICEFYSTGPLPGILL